MKLIIRACNQIKVMFAAIRRRDVDESNAMARVTAALARSDAACREGRAERMIWVSQFVYPNALSWESHEAPMLLEEARRCYVFGIYSATVLVSTAFVEHVLALELELRGRSGRGSFESLIKTFSAEKLLPAPLLAKMDLLRQVRNSLTHRKPDDHEHGLNKRFKTERRAPRRIIADDAKLAIEVMYELHHRTIRELSE